MILAKFALSVSDNPRKKFDSAAETTIFTFQSPKCSPKKNLKKTVHSVVLMTVRHCYALGFRGIRSDCANASHISERGKKERMERGLSTYRLLPDHCKLQRDS